MQVEEAGVPHKQSTAEQHLLFSLRDVLRREHIALVCVTDN